MKENTLEKANLLMEVINYCRAELDNIERIRKDKLSAEVVIKNAKRESTFRLAPEQLEEILLALDLHFAGALNQAGKEFEEL